MNTLALAAGLLCFVSGCQGLELTMDHDVVQQQRVDSPEVSGKTSGGGSWSPAQAMHLVDLVQRLHTDLALTKSAVDGWEDKIDAKMATLEAEVKKSVAYAERSLRDDMKAFQNRFEDRITSLQNRLEDKMETARENADCSNRGSSTSSDMSFVNSQMQKIEAAVSNESQSLLHNLVDAFSQLEDRLDTDLQELSLSINSSAVEMRSYLGSTLSGLGGVTLSEMQSLVTDLPTPKTCRRGMVDALTQATSPYHVIQPVDGDILDAPYLCDTTTDGGGWVIIQRRSRGDISFYRGWADYREGFGSPDTDFWLGNERIHALTSQAEFELRVELKYRGMSAFAQYSTFAITDEKNNYALSLGAYSGGDAEDSLTIHNGMDFTTLDRDNDIHDSGNCAVTYTGAWWYVGCHSSNLNGEWGAGSDKGPVWHSFAGAEPASYTEMKIRRVDN